MEYHGILSRRVLTAMQKRDVEKVQQLLLMPNYDVNYSSQKRITPLILASKLGLLPIVEKLVSLKVDLDHCDLDGRSALHHACCHGNPDVVAFLIGAGASIVLVSQEGDQPLHEAVCCGKPDTVETLISAGSDVNKANHVTRSTPLELAVLHDRSEVVKVLIKHGANLHHKSRAHETALHYAVQVGSTDIIQHLLDAGANIDCVNNIGETPLAIAVQERKLNIVKFLVEAGCKLGHRELLSPVHIACRQNSQDILCYLLSEGINLSQDKWLLKYAYIQLFESNPDLLETVIFLCQNPLPLREACRRTIRSALRPSLVEKVNKLKLPVSVRDWIAADVIYS